MPNEEEAIKKALLIALTALLSFLGFYLAFAQFYGFIQGSRSRIGLPFQLAILLAASPALWFIKKAERWREKKKEEFRIQGMEDEEAIDAKARNYYAFMVIFKALKYFLMLGAVFLGFLLFLSFLYKMNRL